MYEFSMLLSASIALAEDPNTEIRMFEPNLERYHKIARCKNDV
jgi:hypothetical protein